MRMFSRTTESWSEKRQCLVGSLTELLTNAQGNVHPCSRARMDKPMEYDTFEITEVSGLKRGGTFRMGGSMSMPSEQARGARLAASCSGMVSAVMRSREGELFARVISCKCKGILSDTEPHTQCSRSAWQAVAHPKMTCSTGDVAQTWL